jgi:hypothetical protein
MNKLYPIKYILQDFFITSLSLFFSGSQQPFMVQFQSDGFQNSIAIVAMKGFNLVYWQTTTC